MVRADALKRRELITSFWDVASFQADSRLPDQNFAEKKKKERRRRRKKERNYRERKRNKESQKKRKKKKEKKKCWSKADSWQTKADPE